MSLRHPPTDDELREHGLQIAMRFVALVRTGRSYAIGNAAFSRQLVQMQEVLAPLLAAAGVVQVVDFDGDLYVNGARLPLKSTSTRQLEQVQHEFALRAIAGISFHDGLTPAELETFMHFFLASEIYKGAELIDACETAGLRHLVPALQAVSNVAEPDSAVAEAPPEYMAAVQAYEAALTDARLLLTHGTLPPGVQMRHVKRVVMPLVDAALGGLPLDASMAWVQRGPTPAWAHAVQVALLAIAIGARLGGTRAQLAELGVAALLHDVGHEPIAGLAETPHEARTSAQRALIARHTVEGLRRIAACTTFDRTTLLAMRVALEHHDDVHDPAHHAAQKAHTCAHACWVNIADTYVTLLGSQHPRALTLTPYETLGRVLGAFADRSAAPLRRALIEVLGMHPAGQMVRLEDGAIARVLANTPGRPEEPYLEILTDIQGRALPDAGRGAITLLPAGRIVMRALPLAEWPTFESAA